MTDRPDGLPEPGLYENIPFAEYLTWEAASNSGLGVLRRSPLHYKYDRENGEDSDTPAKKQGRAIHAIVLEPEMYGERYRAAGRCSSVTAKNEPCASQGRYLLIDGRSACGTHVKQFSASSLMTDVEVLTLKDAEEVNGCSNAVWQHPGAAELLGSDGPTEVSGVWQDEATGAWCKMRLDKLSKPHRAVVDYKTTMDASPLTFERSIWNYGYHRQGAFYLRGTRALEVEIEHYAIVAQEKPPPYAVAVYRLGAGALSMGDDYIDALLQIYVSCMERDEWAGYSDEVQDIHLPDWAWKAGDDELYELDPTRTA